MSEVFPVYVNLNGTNIRVGGAVRKDDGFVILMGGLTMGPAEPAPSSGASSGASGGAVFPPYGRSKGKPVAGATVGDLEYYAAGCRRTLDDPGKSRWHDKERVLLAAIEAELKKHGAPAGGTLLATPGLTDGLTDDDVPF